MKITPKTDELVKKIQAGASWHLLIDLCRSLELAATTQADEYQLPFGVRFKEAWEEWLAFRKAIRKKMTPMTIKKQLKTLSCLSENDAINTINRSIENGWTGLFPPKTMGDIITAKASGMEEKRKSLGY